MKEEQRMIKVNKRSELIETIRKIWNNLDQEGIRNYVDSMNWRIMKLIHNKGDKKWLIIFYNQFQ